MSRPSEGEVEPRTLGGRAALAAVAAAALSIGWWDLHALAFGTVNAFDDQGYLMLALRHFREGAPLYDDVFSHYGPTFYFVHALAYRLTGWPLDHESIRHIAIALYFTAFLLVAAGVFRATRSLALAVLAHVALLRGLNICLDAGHPQEVCVLLLAAWVFVEAGGLRSRRAGFARGSLAGALVFTKINVGIFGLASLLLGQELPWGGPRARRLYRALAWGVLALPFVLMVQRLGHPAVLRYALLVTLAAVPVLARITRREGPGAGRLELVGLGVAGAFLATWTLAHGTSLGGLVRGVVLRNLHFASYCFMDSELSWAHVAVAALSAALGIATLSPRARVPGAFFVAAKAIFGAAVLSLMVLTRLTPLLGYAVPFLWLGLVPRDGSSAVAPPVRTGLALLALFQTLVAYPTAGAHLALSVFLLVPVAMLCLADARAELERAVASRWSPRAAARLVAILEASGVALGLALHVAAARRANEVYLGRTPLALRGSRGVRAPERDAATDEFLVHNLASVSTMFATLPGLGSLYIWTGEPAPTRALPNQWMVSTDPAEEEGAVRALEATTRPAAVRCRRLIDFWVREPRDLGDRPLVRYLSERFTPAATVNGYELLVPRERPLPSLTYAARVLPGSSLEGGHFAGSIALALPALEGGPVARLVLRDADTDVSLYDTVAPLGGTPASRPGFSVRGAPGSALAVAVTAPVELVLDARGGLDPRTAGFPVVRLLDARGETLGTVPFVEGR